MGRKLALFLGSVLLAGPVLAHHGDAGRYKDTTVSVTGKVVEFDFVNPHSLLSIEVKGKDGSTEIWHGELGSPGSLKNKWGWDRNAFKPGEQITMIGRPRKNGEPFMTLTEKSRILDANGKEIYNGDES
jgi:hypothetical protein